jgi:hypothetical protein
MALGPGKYDDLATDIRTKIHADGVVVIVINGDRGGGFSAQLSPTLTLMLPGMLRTIADEMEDFGPCS